jgi:hypothetical protein
MRAGFQNSLTNTSMVQQVRHQGDGRVDDPQHRFLLEGDIVQSQKHHAVRRKKKDRREGDEREPESGGTDENAIEAAAGEEESAPDPDCGHIVDIRV